MIVFGRIVVAAKPDDIERAYEEFNAFAFVEKEGFDRREFRTMIADAIHELQVSTRDAAVAVAMRAEGS